VLHRLLRLDLGTGVWLPFQRRRHSSLGIILGTGADRHECTKGAQTIKLEGCPRHVGSHPMHRPGVPVLFTDFRY